MNIVSMTACYPSPARPQLGLFVRRRLLHVGRRVGVTVVNPIPCLPLLGPRPMTVEDPPLVVRHIPMPRVPKFPQWNPYWFYRAVRKPLKELIAQNKADLLDAHFVFPEGVGAAMLAEELGIPFTITLRGVLRTCVEKGLYLDRIRAAMDQARAIISVSQSLKDLAVGLGIPDEKVTVIPNAVDHQCFHPGDKLLRRKELNLPASARILVTVGHISKGKGMPRVVAAMPELMKRHLDIHYVVVGGNAPWDGNEDELRRLAASLGLTDRLTITGSIPPEQVAAWLQAADIFVLSTEGEGWCNAIMEALAVGLPVVTTDVGGNREIICRDELGTVVPFDDHGALVRALNEALDRKWDQKAILDYVAPFNWDTVADRTVEVFRQAVGKQDLAQRRKGAEVRRGK